MCMCKYLYSTYIYLHWLFWVRYWWWQQWLQVLMGYTLKKHQLWLHIRFTLGGWDVFLISYNHDHGFSPHKGLLNGLKLHGYALTVLNDMSLMSVQHFSSGFCFFFNYNTWFVSQRSKMYSYKVWRSIQLLLLYLLWILMINYTQYWRQTWFFWISWMNVQMNSQNNN